MNEKATFRQQISTEHARTRGMVNQTGSMLLGFAATYQRDRKIAISVVVVFVVVIVYLLVAR